MTGSTRANVRCALLGFVPVVLVGFDDGGFFVRTWNYATIVFAVVAVLALLVRRAVLGQLALAFLLALALLAAWTLTSGAWGISGTSALGEARRTFLYVAAAAAFVLVTDRRRAPALLAGVLGGVTVLCGYGASERFRGEEPPDPFQGDLLFEPVGYANAMGILAAMGALLGLGLVLYADRWLHRALPAGAAAVLFASLLLTESRGAWLAFGCGIVVLAVLGVTRVRWIAPAGAAALAGALLLSQTSLSLGDRPAYWRAAVNDASEHPLAGSGAGSFDDYWLEHREGAIAVRDAHSLYLETFAELGLVGLVLVVLALGIPLVAAARARGEPLVPAAGAAYVSYLVHAGLDWDWEVPVTTLTALACAAALLAAGETAD